MEKEWMDALLKRANEENWSTERLLEEMGFGKTTKESDIEAWNLDYIWSFIPGDEVRVKGDERSTYIITCVYYVGDGFVDGISAYGNTINKVPVSELIKTGRHCDNAYSKIEELHQSLDDQIEVGDEVEIIYSEQIPDVTESFVVTYCENGLFVSGIDQNGYCYQDYEVSSLRKTGRRIPRIQMYFDSMYDSLYAIPGDTYIPKHGNKKN